MQAGFVTTRLGRLNRAEQYSEYVLMAYPQVLHAAAVTGRSAVDAPLLVTAPLSVAAPPIELAVFKAKELMEETLLRWMHRIISNQQQFTTQLAQRIETPTGKLQLFITDRTPFQQLVQQLKVVSQYISSSDCPEMQFTIRPQLTGAEQACLFSGTVAIKELILLKKQHDFDRYQQVNVFALRP